MIHVADPGALPAVERHALGILVDLARLLPVERGSGDVVSVAVHDAPPRGEASSRALLTHAAFAVEDGQVAVTRTFLRAVAEVVTAAAEQRSDAADRVGRVPTAENALARMDLMREPVVSRIGIALREAVGRAAGRRPVVTLQPWPGGARWAVALSHDLDVVQWWPVFTALRLVELARKGEWRRMLGVASAVPGALRRNPVAAGLDRLVAFEERAGVRATWFVICGSPTLHSFARGDVTYDPASALVRRTLERVLGADHEVGLHGSFATMDDGGAFATERAHLGRLTGQTVRGVRQHFLRMRPGTTHRDMARAGFAYDATFGFADANGFRLGVADVVPGWDLDRDCPSSLDLVPLVWMDRALSKYRGIEDPRLLVADALELAGTCAAVEGLWVGLWHPNLTRPLGYPGSEAAFHHLVESLTEMQPYIAPIGELVSWRQARRAARASAVDARGRPVWGGAAGSAFPPLEDAAGRQVAWA